MLTAAELLDGSWTSAAALLVMPGGADLPYCNRLNGRGNTIIKGTLRYKTAYSTVWSAGPGYQQASVHIPVLVSVCHLDSKPKAHDCIASFLQAVAK
jgi:glutamine amidotransferase-like uncharacterized protein